MQHTERIIADLKNIDALELLATLPDGSVDAIITDPPFGTTAAPWDKEPDYSTFFREAWRVLKKNGVILIFSQNPTAAKIICQQRKFFRYEWIWEKTNAVGVLNTNRMPLRAHELILVFYRHLPTWNKIPLDNQRGKPYRKQKDTHQSLIYNSILLTGTASIDGTRCPRDVVRFSRPQRTIHPTQKPEALVRYLIENYTEPGALIVDPFAGGGTTLAAAASCGRFSVGSEIDAVYFTAACARLAPFNQRVENDTPKTD